MTKAEREARKRYERESAADPPTGNTEQGETPEPESTERSSSPVAGDSGRSPSSVPDMSHRTSTVLFLALTAVGLRVVLSGKLGRAWSALWSAGAATTQAVKK